MPIEFTVDDRTLEVFDPIMRHRASFEFPESIDPVSTSTTDFVFPVDRAVSFRTSGVYQTIPAIFVFDSNGRQLDKVDSTNDVQQFPPDEYYFALRESIKVYLRIDSPTEISATVGDNDARLDFGDQTRVTLGVRSLHERPEATITTTDDPEDVMAAISHFGSALKDTGPMRSFPTLRGHPPNLTLGEELRVPDVLDTPDTGIRLELPPERRYAYAAAPLAYYLGANVEPGDDPKLVTETGQDHSLDEGWNVQYELNRILRRTFFLDTLVRQDDPFCGEYTGRQAFEEVTGISLDGLYDQSPAERLDSYLNLPQDALDRLDFNWLFGARVSPVPTTIEYLPNLANLLAAIYPLQGTEAGTTIGDDDTTSSDPGTTSSDPGTMISGPGTTDTRTPILSFDGIDDETVVDPEPTDTARQLWLGPGIPMGSEKPDIDAIRRGYERDPIQGDIDYVVVCNDERMLDENEGVRDLLDERAGFSFSIETHQQVTVDELRELLARDIEVFHFVGHADRNGFVCADGHLDAATIETVGADVFFLNSCFSYEQGRHILDAGAMAGIVTLGEVENSVATLVGQRVAMLLNHGVQVGGALDIATELSDSADRYTALGNTTFQVVFSDVPGIDTLVEVGSDRVVHSYHLSSLAYLGSWAPHFQADFPANSDVGTPLFDEAGVGFRCVHDKEGYLTQIREENIPLWIDGELRYPSEIDIETLDL